MKIVADAGIPFVTECFSSIGDVEAVQGEKITPGIVADADILLVRTVTAVGAELLSGSKVRFVGTVTIGFDHIDTDFLRQNNIGFTSAPGSNANSVAEYVIAALLNVAQKENLNLRDKSIGIIGVGNIGSKAAEKVTALGMKAYLNDPPLQRQTGDRKYLPLDDLFDCDFITLHTPLTFDGVDKTFHLAGEEFFKSLKPGCVFLNTSRGGVVDTNALKAAIQSGGLKSVVLDVWENEPNIDSELLEMVDIGTPHVAGYSLDGRAAGTAIVYRAACEHFGLKAEFDMELLLPESAVGQLRINSQFVGEQDMLREAVEKVYKISEDDARVRQILVVPAADRDVFFERLRRNYPVHREFRSMQIVLEPPCKSLADKLTGIGFRIHNTEPRL